MFLLIGPEVFRTFYMNSCKITALTVLQYYIANLNRRVLQYQENDLANHNNDGVNRLTDGVNDGVNLESDGVKGDNDVTKQLNRTLQRVYQAICFVFNGLNEILTKYHIVNASLRFHSTR